MSSSAAAANNIVYKKCPVCYEYMIAGLPLSNDEVKCEWGKSGNQDEFSHKKW
jgi:cytochrome c5